MPAGICDWVVVIESAATTVMLSCLVAVCTGVDESVALTVKVVVPAAFGVPVMAPLLAFRDAHVGNTLGATMVQVTGGFPPALCNVAPV